MNFLHRHTLALLFCALAPPVFSQSAATESAGPPETRLEPFTVTGTRERALLAETPAAVGSLTYQSIHDTAPLHPGQLLGQIPGVAVAVTTGEGHTTAIRQPFTTSPVYLFLEDGVPIRPTGFFNHNALYEIDLASAGGVEVVRGPGTALYGSDAIGGIIHVLSRPPVPEPQFSLRTEGGSFGTWRALAELGSAVSGGGAILTHLNATHTDGWRAKTGYDRQSASVRLDQPVGRDATLKTVVSFSRIDQDTGANSPLPLDAYLHDPTRNLMPIAFRQVSALRASVEYERLFDGSMVSVLPYFRDNAMELNGTYNLNSDPRIETTHSTSYGVLAKWRRDLPFLRTRFIVGFDADYSPGSRREDNLFVTRSGSGASTLFRAYERATRIYDYRVTFTSFSPYVHAELSPTSRLRLTAGLRHDQLGFAMRNRLTSGTVQANVLGTTRYYGQIGRDDAEYSRLSPKFGATYRLGRHTHLHAAYTTGFRVPSESQLYRAGNDATAAGALERAQAALGLQPIKADHVEVGLRGRFGRLNYDLAAYNLVKRDDLVTQRDPATNLTRNVNAGRTEHRGIEAGLGLDLGRGWSLDAATSFSRQRYVRWTTASADFSGRQIEAAPKALTNLRLTWRPTAAAFVQLEWAHVGAYWLDAGNSPRFGQYPGHDLLHLRARYALSRHFAVSARVLNLADRRYAESASVTSNTPVFSPGLPRAVYGGLEYTF